MITLLTGDVREVLPTLADASVQCVVTSPPYLGPRDYGTATWEGGAEGCDHSMAISDRDPVPPACRQCQKCGRLCRTRWTSATSVLSECDQCGLTTDHTNVDSRGTWMGVKRDADGDWSLPSKRLPGNICRCGARRIDAQIGLEPTPEAYIAEMVAVFRQVRRVMRDDAVAFVNMGDGFRDKQLLMMPARLALALQADGWWLRSDIIWAKPNPMPESCRDRPTSAHEHVFMLTKKPRYYFDSDAIREPHAEPERGKGELERNNWSVGCERGSKPMVREYNPAGRSCRNVWTIATSPYSDCHFATFPPTLAERCIRAGTSEKGCCGECGAPWVRVTDRQFTPQPGSHKHAFRDAPMDASNGWEGFPRGITQSTTTGWSPSCRCIETPHTSSTPPGSEDQERLAGAVTASTREGRVDRRPGVRPCVVLDPFSGAGTALLVADRLGRDSIGIDLSHAYVEMARERLLADCPLFAEFSSYPPAEDPEEMRMRDLFAEAAE